MKANSKKGGMVLIPFLVVITLFSLVLPANVSAGAGTLSIDSIVVTDELGSTGPNYTNPVTISGNVTVDNGLGNINQYSVQIDWGDGALEDIPNADLDFAETPPDSGVFKGAYASDLHTYDTGGDKAISVLLYHMKSTGKDGESTQQYIGTVNIVLDLASIELGDLNVTYDGSPKPVTFITDPAGLAVTVTYNSSETIPTDAGTYEVIAVINDSNPEVSASGTFTIEKADADISVSGYTGTYDGDPHGATGTATGVKGEDLSADLNLGDSFTNIPGGTANWTFTDFTGNYNDASGSVTIDISKADATIQLGGLNVIYDGSPKSVTIVTDPAGLAVTVTYKTNGSETIPIDAGTYEVIAEINNLDYTGSASGTFTIEKADADVSVSGYTGTYDGATHGASGTAAGVGDVDLSASLNLGDTFTDYPGGTANWTFTGGTNYNDQNGSVDIIINKADATVSVSGWTGTYDGAAHSAAGTATGVNGEDLSVGLDLGAAFTDVPGGTANWTFTGGTNYNDQNGSVDIIINKADATVSVGGWTGTYDGAAHGASGTATGVDGANLSSYLDLGATFTDYPGGIANWTFTDSTGNYNNASGSVAVDIAQAKISYYYPCYSCYEVSVEEPDTTEVAATDDESDTPQPEIEDPAPESLSAPAPDPEPEYFTVDFEGNITTVPMAANGAVMAQVIAGNPEGTNWLEISQGTVLQDSDGAIVNSVNISRTAVPSSDDTRVQVGAAYSCEPSGASFSEPAILTLSFDPQELPQKIASVNLSYFASASGWVDISQSDNTQNPDGQMSGAVDHFSIFAVTASKSPARFAITTMNVSRAKQQYWSPMPFVTIKGKQVSFEIDVQNEGGMDGTFDGVITIDGQQLAINELVVEAGRTGSLFFTVKDMGYGSHTINVGGVTGEFTTSRRINFPLTISTILILTLLLLTAIYLPKRWRKARR